MPPSGAAGDAPQRVFREWTDGPRPAMVTTKESLMIKAKRASRASGMRKPAKTANAGIRTKGPAKAGTKTKTIGVVRKAEKVVLLSGGNPQIAKADGDAPVQTYIAAMPGWKRGVGERLDAL